VLAEAGFDAVLLQNSLDRPTRERVDATTIAQLTRVGVAVAEATDLALGINLHKNDGPGTMAVAAAIGASFVRVKVHTGVVLSAEGLVSGVAEETLAVRQRLGAEIAIWADVHDPTSRPLAGDTLRSAAVDAVDFGAADVLVITQSTVAESCAAIADLRSAVSGTPLVIGGKTTHATIADAMHGADGVIVGSALKETPGIRGEVSVEVARRLVTAAHEGS